METKSTSPRLQKMATPEMAEPDTVLAERLVSQHVARKREAKRRLILDAAGKLFVEKGYGGTTVDDLCQALGVTKPSIYHYFRDKYEIFETICLESADTNMRVFRDADNPDLPIRERLHGCLLELARRTIHHHYAATLTFRDIQYLEPGCYETLRKMGRDYYKDLYALLKIGEAEGVFEFDDLRAAAHSIGSVVGFLYTWFKPGRPADNERMAQTLAGTMLKIVLPKQTINPSRRQQ